MRPAMAVLLVAFLAPTDLDVDIPSGSPLDWTRELSRPVPTGRAAGTPTPATRPKPGAGTQVEDPRLAKLPGALGAEYASVQLYDHFRVLTLDLMSHVACAFPKSTGRVSQDEVATGGGFVMQWNYPPELPAELYWTAATAYLRCVLHPQVSPWPETAAFCLELGEPAHYAGDVIKGMRLAEPERASGWVVDKIKPLPKDPPTPPTNKDPRQAILNRLVAVELSGGYPFALDPTFARRTLGMGDVALPSVLACAKDDHPFLARNAVAVLVHYADPKAVEELKALLKDTRDPVVRARILLGLARRGEASMLPDFVREAESIDPPIRAIGMHCLGLLRDRKGAVTIEDAIKAGGIRELKDTDLLWSAIPALARMRAGKEVLLDVESQLWKKCHGNDVVRTSGRTRTPEDQHARFKVLRQMCLLALAANGEKKYVDELMKRAKENLGSFYPSVWYLLVDVLAQTDAGAAVLRKRVVDEGAAEMLVRLEALRALAREGRLDAPYLKDKALDPKADPSLRSLALQLLAAVDAPLMRDAAVRIVEEFAKGTGEIGRGWAFVVCTAVRVGGPVGALPAKDLAKAAERALQNNLFARREGTNTVDISKASVVLFPPLLETCALELGRTGSEDALPVLEKILAKGRPIPGRAEAALGLGAVPGKAADALLVETLSDADGWTRWCAYLGLALRSKQDHLCDWVFGDNEHRRRPTEAYKKWGEGK